jgi:anti-anti-sigma factor
MQSFAVEVAETEPQRFVVTVSGELDLATADRLWTRLEPLIGPGTVVVVDGTEMTFLDSSGLRVLLLAGNRAASGSAVFRLVAPQPAVQRVLSLAGVGSHLETRQDVASALAG